MTERRPARKEDLCRSRRVAEGNSRLHCRRCRQDRIRAHGADRSASDRQVPGQARARPSSAFGLESGSTSAWLWREFRPLGLPVVCLDSRHAHRVLSMKRNKNDRNDARGLADLVRMGWYREARVRSIDAQFVRSMLLARQQLLQSRRAIENQIRGALKTLGVMTSSTKGRGFMPRVVGAQGRQRLAGPRPRSAARRPCVDREAAEDRVSQRTRRRPRGRRCAPNDDRTRHRRP